MGSSNAKIYRRVRTQEETGMAGDAGTAMTSGMYKKRKGGGDGGGGRRGEGNYSGVCCRWVKVEIGVVTKIGRRGRGRGGSM